MLEKTLKSPMDCKEIKPVHPKGDQSEYSLEGLMLKLKFYIGHLMQRSDSLEKTLMLGKTCCFCYISNKEAKITLMFCFHTVPVMKVK